MKTIEIDDQVYAYLAQHARPFVDKTENAVIRRLLNLGNATPVANHIVPPALAQTPSNAVTSERRHSEARDARTRTKARKADLALLVQRGVLKPGQSLHLVDYRNNRVLGVTAQIAGSELSFKGKQYSMSYLAQQQLEREGYASSAVRGPTHWVTDAGKSVAELWQGMVSGS